MTDSKFETMNEQEQRELARRLAEDSEVLDFEQALEIVQWKPAEAERMLRMGEESKKRQEEFARNSERRRRALLELL